jgi:triphosphoribosyl-dephospho-CoA synthetase
MTQRYLRGKTFGPAPSPASSANLNTPIGASRRTGNTIFQKLLRRGAGSARAMRKPSGLSANLVKPSPRGLASLALKALVEEAELTPKPALVDGRGPGAQTDLSLSLMRRSAQCLAPFFELMALTSLGQIPTQTLREELGTIGRWAEHAGEARAGFPSVIAAGLPRLRLSRQVDESETLARLNALLAIMTRFDDPCLLYRAGPAALKTAQDGAASILEAGGVATREGWRLLQQLDHDLLILKGSPEGSADMLSATIFIDYVSRNEESKYEGSLTRSDLEKPNGAMGKTIFIL